MAIQGVASSGIMSGIDAGSLISQMMTIEERPIQLLQHQQSGYDLKISTILSLSTKLGTYNAALKSLNDSEKFNTIAASVSKTSGGTELLTASASSDASAGNYELKVSQLATSSKKAAQGWVDQNSTAIASATGSFAYKVGLSGAVETIGITSSTTLQELRDLINTADAGVSASIVNDGTGSNPYRLILTADDSGSANTIYITDNDTDLDFANKQIEALYANTDNSFSGSAYSNSGNYYTGTDNLSYITKVTTAGSTTGALADRAKYKYSTDGGITWSSEITVSTGGADSTADIVIDSTNKTLYRNGAAVTLSEGTYTGSGLATEIQTQLNAVQAGHTASYDSATRKYTITNSTGSAVTFNWDNSSATAAGVLGYDTVESTVADSGTDVSDFDAGMFIDDAKISNSTNGRVKLLFGTSGTLSVDDKFNIDVFNPEMQEAKDAVITVDNATIVKSTNTITDAIEGITLNLLQADSTETLNLSVTSSSSTALSAIEEFVESYNNLTEFIQEQLSYDPEDGTTNPLIGDPTLLEIQRKISNSISGVIPGLSTESYTNLSQIGITSDYKTGELEIDNNVLSRALSANPDNVAKLFIGTGTVTNQSIAYESKTSATNAGKYGISIATAPEQAVLDGDNDLSTTTLAVDETLIFKYSDNYTETDSSTTAFSATLTAGSTINTIVTTLNSTFATKDIALTASNNNGVLKIKSDSYGEDIWFQVSSDQLTNETDSQIWDKTTWDNAYIANSSYIMNDGGVDIAGSINNHVAIGKGNTLTATAGFLEEGLVISTTSNQTGLFGSIYVSRGIADTLPSIIDSYIDSDDGILKLKEDSLQDSIDDMQDRITIMAQRMIDKEDRLLAEFNRLEVLMSKFNIMSDFITNTLSAIPKIGEYN